MFYVIRATIVVRIIMFNNLMLRLFSGNERKVLPEVLSSTKFITNKEKAAKDRKRQTSFSPSRFSTVICKTLPPNKILTCDIDDVYRYVPDTLGI